MSRVRVFYPSGKEVFPAGHPSREDSSQPRPAQYPADERPTKAWTVAQLTEWAADRNEELPTGLKDQKVRAAQDLYDTMHQLDRVQVVYEEA